MKVFYFNKRKQMIAQAKLGGLGLALAINKAWNNGSHK
jgi:hypothetical protein